MGNDSLVCYSDSEHRGYFHLRDGHIVVSPTYEHAWVFSNGLAAVEQNGKVRFINNEGKTVIDKGFSYCPADDYVFHEGRCAVRDSTGRFMGLINGSGEWVVPPVYKEIIPTDTFWIIKAPDMQTLLTFDMDTVMPPTQGSFSISDTLILVTYTNHTQSTFSLQGRLMVANQIRDVEQMLYDTREVVYPSTGSNDEAVVDYRYDYSPTMRKAVATCLRYEAECDWYGLMSADGRQLTLPSYRYIEAVGKDLYLCKTDYGRGVVLNSKGQRVE